MPIELDWQITEAPHGRDDPEPLPPPDKRPPPKDRPNRRSWLLAFTALLLLTAAGLLALRQVSRKGWEQVTNQVAALVKLEETLALAGDLEPLLALQDPEDHRWREIRATLTLDRQPAPIPLLNLTPVGEQLIIRSIAALDADVVIADVEREYTTADGSVLSFHGPQFYRRTDEAGWVRIAPPAEFWGQPGSWNGGYLHVLYFPPDEPAVAELAPLLDVSLQETCLTLKLDCAPILPVSLWFGHDPLLALPAPWARRLVTLNISGATTLTGDETYLALPSLQYNLLPADDAARDALVARLGFHVARFLTQKLYGDTPLAQEVFRRVIVLGDGAWTAVALPAAETVLRDADSPGLLPGAPSPDTWQALTPAAPDGLDRLEPGLIVIYTVVSGDTLVAIAAHFNSYVSAIVAESDLEDPDYIQAGQVLRIPVNIAPAVDAGPQSRLLWQSQWAMSPPRSSTGSPARASLTWTYTGAYDISWPALLRPSAPGAGGYYRARTFDTLEDIADKLGVSPHAILDTNPWIVNPDHITPGQLIAIPEGPPGPSSH